MVKSKLLLGGIHRVTRQTHTKYTVSRLKKAFAVKIIGQIQETKNKSHIPKFKKTIEITVFLETKKG